MHELRQLLSIVEPSARGRLALVVVFTALAGLVEIGGVSLIVPFMAVVTSDRPFGFSGQLAHSVETACLAAGIGPSLVPLALGGLLIAGLVFSNLLLCLHQYILQRIIHEQHAALNIRLVRQLAAMSLEWYGQRNTAELSSTVLADSNLVTVGALNPALQLVALALRCLVIGGFFIFLQPHLALGVALSLAVSYSVVLGLVRRPLVAAGESYGQAVSLMYRGAGDLFGGIREIRATGSSDYFLQRFTRAALGTVNPQVMRAVPGPVTRAGLEAATVASLVALMVYFRYKDGNLANGLPLLSAYALAGVRLLPAIQQGLYYSMELKFSLSAVGRVAAILALTPPFPAPDLGARVEFRQRLRLDDVTYRYPGGGPVVQGVTVDIPRQSRVAFVGETGAGKSTLVDLIMGLRFPESGHFTVDGQPLTPVNAAAWHKQIGYVPQSIYLLDASIEENVAFGEAPGELDLSRVQRACRAASIDDFVAELPEGYRTTVGERGTRLSGGQCQRLGIARALYHDPEVIVFDEATSALDNQTESAILSTFQTLKGHKTLIVIAHRLSTVRDFDRLFVIDRGRLVGEGTFAELSVSCPRFRELLEAAPKA